MAARKLRPRHQDDIRQKIQASVLVNRLTRHVKGEVEMTASQVSAARVLLDKALSNAPTEISGPQGGPVQFSGIAWHIVDTHAAGA